MEIWLIEEGERTGPYQDYEVRERIARGEVSAETKGWHRDQGDWLPLREMSVFSNTFEEPGAEGVPGSVTAPPPLPATSSGWGEIWMRFLARWTDIQLYQLLVFGGLMAFGANLVTVMGSGWFFIGHLMPMLIIEGILISRFGRTPGKWLAGATLESSEGGRLSLGASLRRACRVFIMGVGLLLPIIPLICQSVALWIIRRRGVAPWDIAEKNVVRLPEIRPGRVVALAIVLVILFLAKNSLILVAMFKWKDDLPEVQREQIEEFQERWEEVRKMSEPGA